MRGMIKFIPVNKNTSTKNIYTLYNTAAAVWLNKEFGNINCPIHSDKESSYNVDLSNADNALIESHVCCHQVKELLYQQLQEKNTDPLL